jgi:hypothetical protein
MDFFENGLGRIPSETVPHNGENDYGNGSGDIFGSVRSTGSGEREIPNSPRFDNVPMADRGTLAPSSLSIQSQRAELAEIAKRLHDFAWSWIFLPNETTNMDRMVTLIGSAIEKSERGDPSIAEDVEECVHLAELLRSVTAITLTLERSIALLLSLASSSSPGPSSLNSANPPLRLHDTPPFRRVPSPSSRSSSSIPSSSSSSESSTPVASGLAHDERDLLQRNFSRETVNEVDRMRRLRSGGSAGDFGLSELKLISAALDHRCRLGNVQNIKSVVVLAYALVGDATGFGDIDGARYPRAKALIGLLASITKENAPEIMATMKKWMRVDKSKRARKKRGAARQPKWLNFLRRKPRWFGIFRRLGRFMAGIFARTKNPRQSRPTR